MVRKTRKTRKIRNPKKDKKHKKYTKHAKHLKILKTLKNRKSRNPRKPRKNRKPKYEKKHLKTRKSRGGVLTQEETFIDQEIAQLEAIETKGAAEEKVVERRSGRNRQQTQLYSTVQGKEREHDEEIAAVQKEIRATQTALDMFKDLSEQQIKKTIIDIINIQRVVRFKQLNENLPNYLMKYNNMNDSELETKRQENLNKLSKSPVYKEYMEKKLDTINKQWKKDTEYLNDPIYQGQDPESGPRVMRRHPSRKPFKPYG
jgi:hypothetical protein